jgi:NAD(P)H-hydrate epimerase
MKQILRPHEIRLADQKTIEAEGIPSIDLMERAAQLFCQAFLNRFPDAGKKGLVLCGPGNNGGDGLAIARLLSADFEVQVFLVGREDQQTEDFRTNLKSLPASVKVLDNLSDLEASLPSFHWTIDALLGTGINRPLENPFRDLVKVANAFTGLRVSVDVPTGLLTEMPDGALAFQSHWTGTFHSPKLQLLFPEFQSFCPEFSVLDLGLVEPGCGTEPLYWTDPTSISRLLKPRSRFAHKGTFGHALLMAGSSGKVGAAVLAGSALLRSGVGLTTLFSVKGAREIIQTCLPEAMFLASSGRDFMDNVPTIGGYQAIGIGPGIGTEPETGEMLEKLLHKAVNPLVLDADALNLIARKPSLLSNIPPGSILTPHPKEFERLAGKSTTNYEVFLKARLFAKTHQVVLVLKGAYTLTVSPKGPAWFNSTGNSGMACGGSGDVLTGILTGLLAQGYLSEDAAILGVFLHGLAGDFASQAHGPEAMKAGDLVQHLGQAFQFLHKQT